MNLRNEDTPEAREIWRKVDLAASRVRWGPIGSDLIHLAADAWCVYRASDVSAQDILVSVPSEIARHCAVMLGRDHD